MLTMREQLSMYKSVSILIICCLSVFACSDNESPATSEKAASPAPETAAVSSPEAPAEASAQAEIAEPAADPVETASAPSQAAPASAGRSIEEIFSGNQVAPIINDGYQAEPLVPEPVQPLQHKVVNQDEIYKSWPGGAKPVAKAANYSVADKAETAVEDKVSAVKQQAEEKVIAVVADVTGQSKEDVAALAATAGATTAAAPAAAGGQEHVINAKGLTAFDKPILYIAPGDTVHFKKLNGGHNSQSVFVPEGAESWAGKMNANISVTLTVPGFYGYICLPHAGLGMNGVIVVGDAGDKEATMEYLRGLPQTDFARKLLGKVNKVKPEMYVK